MITSLPGLSWTALPANNNSGSICLVFFKCTKAGFFRLLLQLPYLPHKKKAGRIRPFVIPRHQWLMVNQQLILCLSFIDLIKYFVPTQLIPELVQFCFFVDTHIFNTGHVCEVLHMRSG